MDLEQIKHRRCDANWYERDGLLSWVDWLIAEVERLTSELDERTSAIIVADCTALACSESVKRAFNRLTSDYARLQETHRESVGKANHLMAEVEEAARAVESYSWSAVALNGQRALDDLAKQIRGHVGMAPTWRAEPPNEQALWWWWNEDGPPIPVSIFASGHENVRYFATAGQYGWNRTQWVEEMGGMWMRLLEPAVPKAIRAIPIKEVTP